MATHSSVLAWRIPGTGEPGGLPSIGSHRVGHDWSDLAAAAAAAEHTHLLLNNHFTFSKMTLHKHMNPTVSQCPEKENRGTIFWTFLLTKCVNYQAFYKTIPYITTEASLVAQMAKNLPTVWETWVQFLGREDPLEKRMATHSSILARKMSWIEEPGRLQSMGSQRIGHDWVTNTSSLPLHNYSIKEVNWGVIKYYMGGRLLLICFHFIVTCIVM